MKQSNNNDFSQQNTATVFSFTIQNALPLCRYLHTGDLKSHRGQDLHSKALRSLLATTVTTLVTFAEAWMCFSLAVSSWSDSCVSLSSVSLTEYYHMLKLFMKRTKVMVLQDTGCGSQRMQGLLQPVLQRGPEENRALGDSKQVTTEGLASSVTPR